MSWKEVFFLLVWLLMGVYVTAAASKAWPIPKRTFHHGVCRGLGQAFMMWFWPGTLGALILYTYLDETPPFTQE